MYGPHVAILLMCVSHNMRPVDFCGLTGSQRTPRVWGVRALVYKYLELSVDKLGIRIPRT